MEKKNQMDQKRKYYRAPVEEHNKMRMEYVGNLLREYRNETMLSRKEFAAEYGISRSLVERIENGKIVTVHSLMRYLDAIQVSPEIIFEQVS